MDEWIVRFTRICVDDAGTLRFVYLSGLLVVVVEVVL